MKRTALSLLIACAAATPVAAQTDRQAEELAEIEARLQERAEEEKRLKDEAEERAREVTALRRRMIETANSLQSAEKRLGEISAELARIDAESDVLEASLLAEQETLGDVLAALQSMELARPPALLVSPDDANKAARAAILLADAAPTLEGRARALREDIERLAALREERDRERAAFEKTNEEIQSRREVLAELLTKKLAERDVAASLAAAAQKETAALAARARSLREVIERLERLARAITPRLKPPPPKKNQPAPSLAKRPASRPEPFSPARSFAEARGSLRPPVVGRIAGAFGAPRADGGRFDGVRFAVSGQAIVTAPYEGAVAFARAWNPIGNLVVLDVGGGYHILVIGVGAFLVEEGQTVAAGEPIGTVGGGQEGAEAVLDLEIRKQGEPVNPTLWLSKKSIEEMAY